MEVALIGLGSALLSIATGGDVASSLLSAGLGTALSFTPLGPVGGVIGSVLGGLLGGLFGSQPNPTSRVNALLGPSGLRITRVKGDQTSGMAEGLNSIAEAIGQILDAIGGELSRDLQVNIRYRRTAGYGYEVRDPLTGLARHETQIGGGASLDEAVQKATLEALRIAAQGGALAADPVYRNILRTAGSADEIRQLVSLAQQVFKELRPEPVSALRQQLDALNRTFDQAKAVAEKFGTTVAEIARRQQEAIADLTAQFNQDIATQILQLTNPSVAALRQIQDAFQAAASDAQLVGGDLDQVRRLFALQAMRAAGPTLDTLQQQVAGFQNRADMLAGFRQGLLLQQGVTPLKATDQLAAAERQYQDLVRRGRLGDEAAVDAFPALAQLLLDLARQVHASGSDYNAVFDQVQQDSQALEDVQRRHLDTAQAQLDQLQALVAKAGDQAQALADAQRTLEETLRLIATWLPPVAAATQATSTGVQDLRAEIAHQAARPAAAATVSLAAATFGAGSLASVGGGGNGRR